MRSQSFLDHFLPNTSRKHMAKKYRNVATKYFESLESRVLLTAFVWDGGGDGTTWSDEFNWVQDSSFPQAANDEAAFNNTSAINVKIDDDYTIAKLTVKNDSNVVLLAVGGHYTLAVARYENTSSAWVGGNVVLEQDNTHETILQLAKQSPEDGLTLEAWDFTVTGNTDGQSAFIIGSGTSANINTDLTADGYFFKLENHSFMMAANVIITGKATTLPATVFPESTIDGELHIANLFKIGGVGVPIVKVIDGGNVHAGQLSLRSGAKLHINASDSTTESYFYFNQDSDVGDAGVDSDTELFVEKLGVLEGTAKLSIGGGTKIKVKVHNGGKIEMSSQTFEVKPATTVGAAGPQISIEGINGTERSTLYAGLVTVINDGAGGNRTGGAIYLADRGCARVDDFRLGTNNAAERGMAQLQIEGGAIVYVKNRIYLDYPGGFAAMNVLNSIVNVSGAGVGVFVGDVGETTGAVLSVLGNAIVNLLAANAKIKKFNNGLVNGGGWAHGTVVAADGSPKNGDIAPGDYYLCIDDGELIVNEENENPFARFNLLGDLEDEGTLALDIVLGTSGQNSSLYVSGNATLINSRLNLEALVDSSAYLEQDSFTILTVDGTFSGQFFDMPEGRILDDDELPTLDAGLGWFIHYGEHEVTLTVKEIATHFSSDSRRTDLSPNSAINIAGQVLIGQGYGYSSPNPSAGTWDLADDPTDFPNQSSAISWTHGQQRDFSIYMSDEGEVTFELEGYTNKTFSYSGGTTDLYLRAATDLAGASVEIDNLVLNGEFSIDDYAYAAGSSGLDILWIPGLGTQFTSISGELEINFPSGSDPFSGTNIGMQVLLGTSADYSPVTVTSTINTAGHVTLAWENLSSNTTVMEITRSDDGGNTWSSALYTTSSLTGSTYTDTTGDHVGSIYKVNQKEFTYGWLEVPTIVIPAANPTLTVNLNDSGDLDGVRFEMDETDPSLMNILVDDVLTAQFAAGRIGELVVNGANVSNHLTFAGDIYTAVTINDGGYPDYVTLDGGNWGAFGNSFTYSNTDRLNFTLTNEAWIGFSSGIDFQNLSIDADCALVAILDEEDAITFNDSFNLGSNALLEIQGGQFIAGAGIGNNSQITVSGNATFTFGEYSYMWASGNIDVLGEGTLLLEVDITNEGVITVNSGATLEIATGHVLTNSGTMNFYDGSTITADAEGILNNGMINWYAGDASQIGAIDNQGLVVFNTDMDVAGVTLSSGLFQVTSGVTLTASDDFTLEGWASMQVLAGSVLNVTGGTTTIGASSGNGYLQVDGNLFADGESEVIFSGTSFLSGEGNFTLDDALLEIESTSQGWLAFGGEININEDGTVEIAGALSSYGTLNVNTGGALTIASGGTFTLYDTGILNIDGGTVTNAGSIRWEISDISALANVDNSGTFIFAANCDFSSLTLDSGSTFEIAAGVTVTLGTNWTNNGLLIVNSGATLTVDTGVTVTNYGEIDLPTGHNDSFIDNEGEGFVVFV